MRSGPPAHRALNVVKPFEVYLVIGRRPSGVYVDSSYQATTRRDGAQPLWDLVFETVTAEPGDQIQDRPGGIVLVGKDGESRAVQLSPPRPRTVDTAFTHAEAILAADRALIESGLAEGTLATGSIRRIKAPMRHAKPNHQVFGPDQPLVAGG